MKLSTAGFMWAALRRTNDKSKLGGPQAAGVASSIADFCPMASNQRLSRNSKLLVNLCSYWLDASGTLKCFARLRFLDWWCLFCGLRYRDGFPSCVFDSLESFWSAAQPNNTPLGQRGPWRHTKSATSYNDTRHRDNQRSQTRRKSEHTESVTVFLLCCRAVAVVRRFSTEFSLGRGEGEQRNVAQHGSAPTKPRTERLWLCRSLLAGEKAI